MIVTQRALKGHTSIAVCRRTLSPAHQEFPLCRRDNVRSGAKTSSVHTSPSALARLLTQTFVTTGRLITFPLGGTAFPAPNSRRDF